jgi:hypothetical protein
MKKTILLGASLLAITFNIQAQDVDKMETKFDYIQLPSKPLDKSIKNYTSKVVSGAEAINKKLMDDYNLAVKKAEADYQKEMLEYAVKLKEAEAEYQKELLAYPALLKYANDTYLKEKELYDKKSIIKKLAERELGEEGKPVKNIPREPYKKIPNVPYKNTPPMPQLAKVFNAEQLAGTYLKLEGFKPGATNAVNITAQLGDLSPLVPEMKIADMTYYSNGKSTPYKAYSYQIKYKRLITLLVETPQGVVYNEVPMEINKDLIYKSPGEFKSEYELNNWWSSNKARIQDLLENETVEKNLSVIQTLLNDNYAFKKVNYVADIYLVKDKKVDYTDYQNAYLAVIEGYNSLTENYEKVAAKAKINEAIAIWEKALLESDVENKKARIDEDVTYATYLNLIEAYIFVDDFSKAKSLTAKLTTYDIPRKVKKRMEELTVFASAQNERFKGFYAK